MALTEQEVIEILKETGALQQGHFRLSSGLHSGNYVQCSQLLKFPNVAEKICSELAEKFKEDQIEMVVGPAIGGILVALAILALRSVFKKTSSGGCAGCSGCNGCGPSCHGQDQETASK